MYVYTHAFSLGPEPCDEDPSARACLTDLPGAASGAGLDSLPEEPMHFPISCAVWLLESLKQTLYSLGVVLLKSFPNNFTNFFLQDVPDYSDD